MCHAWPGPFATISAVACRLRFVVIISRKAPGPTQLECLGCTEYEVGPDARPAGCATAAPTQSASSLSRDGLGAGTVAPDASIPSLDRATRRDSTERGGPAGAGSKSSIGENKKAGNCQNSFLRTHLLRHSDRRSCPMRQLSHGILRWKLRRRRWRRLWYPSL
jgi:hypothetical protein